MNIPTMEITTGIGCRNNCLYCPQKRITDEYRKKSSVLKMSFDTFKKCVSKIPKRVRIDFSGMAEPWFNDECSEMLLYAHRCKFKIQVYTTCTGMTFRDIELIKDIPFDLFEVHLPDNDGLTHIKVNDDYLSVIDKISKSNIQNLRYMTVGTIDQKVRQLLKEPVREDSPISRAGHIKDINGISPLSGIIICSRCSVNFNNNVLLPSGDVLLCCMDYGMKHILGNLLCERYDNLFKSQEFRRLQKGLCDSSVDMLCRTCEAAKTVDSMPENNSFFRKIGRIIQDIF